FGSLRYHVFHAHRVPWIARLRRFDRVIDRTWHRSRRSFQKRTLACPWAGRVVLALCRRRVGVRVFGRLPLAFNPMTTQQFFVSAWTWNTAPLVVSALALAAYAWAFGVNRRILYLIAGLSVFVLTLVSPLNALADGYLFSAHMLQHILLLLIVPALLLTSLPRCVSLGPRSSLLANPLAGWVAGVGAMWLWH